MPGDCGRKAWTIEGLQGALSAGDLRDEPAGGGCGGVEGDAADEQKRAYSLAAAHEGHHADQGEEIAKNHPGTTFAACDV